MRLFWGWTIAFKFSFSLIYSTIFYNMSKHTNQWVLKLSSWYRGRGSDPGEHSWDFFQRSLGKFLMRWDTQIDVNKPWQEHQKMFQPHFDQNNPFVFFALDKYCRYKKTKPREISACVFLTTIHIHVSKYWLLGVICCYNDPGDLRSTQSAAGMVHNAFHLSQTYQITPSPKTYLQYFS